MINVCPCDSHFICALHWPEIIHSSALSLYTKQRHLRSILIQYTIQAQAYSILNRLIENILCKYECLSNNSIHSSKSELGTCCLFWFNGPSFFSWKSSSLKTTSAQLCSKVKQSYAFHVTKILKILDFAWIFAFRINLLFRYKKSVKTCITSVFLSQCAIRSCTTLWSWATEAVCVFEATKYVIESWNLPTSRFANNLYL